MKRLAPLALVAALALAGCTAGNQSADATPSATTTPSASPTVAPAVSSASPSATKTKKVDARQAWADDIVILYLNGQGAHSFKAFSDTALSEVESWKSTSAGKLEITVSGKGNYQRIDYVTIADQIMSTAGYEITDLEVIDVVGRSGKKYISYSRDDMGNPNIWATNS